MNGLLSDAIRFEHSGAVRVDPACVVIRRRIAVRLRVPVSTDVIHKRHFGFSARVMGAGGETFAEAKDRPGTS
jgi:hypothetical protein